MITGSGRKRGLRFGMRDRSAMDLSRFHADIKAENHEFIREVAKKNGIPVSCVIDEWISRKRAKYLLRDTANNAVNSGKSVQS
jgi:hypothetical protein